MDYYKRAVELNDDTVANRRYIHENAEDKVNIFV